MTSEVLRTDELDPLVAAALAARRDMVVVAPNGTVNTGLVTGDQRQIVSASADGGLPAGPMRQGPVRAKDLKVARRRFVPPPGFEDVLAALDSGVSVLVGAPGTGRETHALNLLAHGRQEAALVQVDGAVDLTRWVPRPRGVHGYLVMEPADPFALRPWDLSRLEAPLAEAGVRLLIVLADAPGLATALEDQLGTPVLRHLPPDPRKVFAAHLADLCPDGDRRSRLLRSLGPDLFDELLPAELPPRHAAQAADVVARLGTGGASCAEVLHALAREEAPELVGRAREDPILLAHLLSLSVYGGLDHGVVTERAADLLALTGAGPEQEPAARSPLRQQAVMAGRQSMSDTLRALGAHRTRQPGTDATDTVSFFWPAVGDAVWDVLCREHTDLLPPLHPWLAGTGYEPDQIERAGQAVAAMAVATGGRTLELLRPLALAQWPPAAEVAARCLGTAVRDPAAATKADDLLEQWSAAPEAALRKVVAYACRSDRGRFTDGQALRLLHRLMAGLSDDADDVAVATAVAEALVQRFTAGDSRSRGTILGRLRDWAGSDGVPARLVALTFPAMAGKDLAWCRGQILADDEMASGMVQLTGHALDESTTYPSMRDVLLAWCREAGGASRPDPALEELLRGLVAARQPGFLRWLLAVERGPDAMPGKELAARLLAMWRSKTPATYTD
ncbi:hypothetical protein PV416_06590 [Streptomyces ipomoeae]|uniref:Uncharacterized protein n=2 Tax=Streptomyces ipomoeae TaxID=103232 RepID=L1L4M1_9ACTN|nr:hypothetical protein [Streptomyces ipomoeae]EKX67558.1 hypothetical protein STRIP9103_00989 [Streptomyces ipomoeae 91-03]MDX2692638.1 hypothetical protein [Streptomyces ipomoeae]MDX2820764.1 hypothetical protein [Streptomyces ipomoeae]MDX2837563.1 hypothetical protein [Streptomyces ipomoeae]